MGKEKIVVKKSEKVMIKKDLKSNRILKQKSSAKDNESNNLNEITSISEKVKFWEEQARLNSELIPRVIKNHELIKSITSKITVLSDEVNRMELIVSNDISRDLMKFNDKIITIENELNFINNKIDGIKTEIYDQLSREFADHKTELISILENTNAEQLIKYKQIEMQLAVNNVNPTQLKEINKFNLRNRPLLLSVIALILSIISTVCSFFI